MSSHPGALGEALRRSCFTAAYALRCAAGRLAKLSGDQPPPEVKRRPFRAKRGTEKGCEKFGK